jgi:hypothetical protein
MTATSTTSSRTRCSPVRVQDSPGRRQLRRQNPPPGTASIACSRRPLLANASTATALPRSAGMGLRSPTAARILASLPLRERGNIWVNRRCTRRGRPSPALASACRSRDEARAGSPDRDGVGVVGPDGRSQRSCMPESMRRWRCEQRDRVSHALRTHALRLERSVRGRRPRVSRRTEDIRRYLPESLMQATTDVEGRRFAWRINVSKSRAAHLRRCPSNSGDCDRQFLPQQV